MWWGGDALGSVRELRVTEVEAALAMERAGDAQGSRTKSGIPASQLAHQSMQSPASQDVLAQLRGHRLSP